MFPLFSFSLIFCNCLTILSFLSSIIIFSFPTLIHHLCYLHCFLWVTWIRRILFVIDCTSFDLLFEWVFNLFEGIEEVNLIFYLIWFIENNCLKLCSVYFHFFIIFINFIFVKVNWIFIFWNNGFPFIQKAALIDEVVRFNIFWVFKIFSWSQNTSCNQEFLEH